MPFLRFLLALACVSLIVSGLMLQNGPHDLVVDACPWLHAASLACPAWMSPQRIPDFAPFALYALAGLGILIVISPLLRGALDQPPEITLQQFIQRGRDLHERCRKEGDPLVQPDIDAWTAEVTAFLRRLGHRYVVAFGDFRDIQLFASQYDTAATIEIRQRLHRLNEFLQRFRDESVPSA
jgi:hypothetical protein